MYIGAISIGLCWGMITGYLLLRALDSFLVLGIFSHGLLMNRWKRLEVGAATGQIKPGGILWLMLPVMLYLLISLTVLKLGYDFSVAKMEVDYGSPATRLCIGTTIVIFASCLSAGWKRLVIAWRISHGYNYGEKRMWTQILKF